MGNERRKPAAFVAHQASIEIKRRINRFEIRPGVYPNEAQITHQLKIRRTPVHQALDRLMHESLVQAILRRGVMVQWPDGFFVPAG